MAYNIQYGSVGANFSDFLSKLLVDREVRKRQEQLDALNEQEKNRKYELEQRNAVLQENELNLRQEQEARNAADSKRNFDQTKWNQDDLALSRRADDDMPGDFISAEEKATRDSHGRSGSYATRALPKANLILDSEGNAPGVSSDEQAHQAELPDTIESFTARGGSKYLAQLEAERVRTAQAKAAQDAAKERVDADRKSRDQNAREHNETMTAIANSKNQSEPLDVEMDARESSDGTKYIDLSMYTGRERAQARREAHAKGITALGKEDAAAVVEAQGALANLDYVEKSMLSKLPKDAQGRLTAGPSNKLSQYFQSDDQLGASGALRAAAIKSLRAAAGSKGFRMTEAEITLAVENDIPRVTDTVGVAKQKLNHMRTLIRNAEHANLGKPGAAPDVDQSSTGFVVTDPAGGKHSFATQALADAFKQKAGIG